MIIHSGAEGASVNNSKAAQANLDYRAVLDAMGQGVLLFDDTDHWVMDNLAARAILGMNLTAVRSEGWKACAMLLDARRTDSPSAEEARAKALDQTEPVRFSALISGTYIPCWAAAIYGAGGTKYTLITLEQPDWKPLTELLGTFRNEARMSISSTRGHAQLITQLATKRPDNITVEGLAKRVTGFAEIMATHMYRLQMLMELLQRLEMIRTGQLVQDIRTGRRKLFVAEFVEDFLEELADNLLVDPSRTDDVRERLILDIPKELTVNAPPYHFANILRDLLRNAVQYSPSEARIILRGSPVQQGRHTQIDVIDEGYGVRAKETERVFAAFQRARQPQIIGEFGYGLSLYCAKAEVEAMGGRIWFESEEGVGSTFSFKLPAWRD